VVPLVCLVVGVDVYRIAEAAQARDVERPVCGYGRSGALAGSASRLLIPGDQPIGESYPPRILMTTLPRA